MRFFFPGIVVILIIALAARRRRRASAGGDVSRGDGSSVQVDAEGVTHQRADGSREYVRWDALRHIHVETVAGGLSADDVTWVLTGSGGEAVRVSQTAPGADTMIARLQQLEGFRYEPMIESMITTDATRFVVWEKA